MMFKKEEIKSILSDIIECPVGEISDEILLSDLGYDSLMFVSTVVEIELKYGIEMHDSDLVDDNFKNVLSICETLKKYFDENSQELYKCVITDCDGVLWQGISGESGEDQAYSDKSTENFCKLLHELRKKGILLAICSKNERGNIDTMLSSAFVDLDDFAMIETNVSDKFDSISHILSEFGFFPDNALYIDDSEAEIAYVKAKIPEITVLKADYIENATERLSMIFSNIPTISTDRTTKFREQKEREKIHKNTSSPEEYNRILETKVVCDKATKEDASRLSELSQRANRFNLAGARYTEDEIVNMLNNRDYSVYKLCAGDKFGDMGLVAMAVVHGDIIESFIMSCRVFRRGFESKLLNRVLSEYDDDVVGLYHPTGRNEYCVNFYKDSGVKYELL